MTTARQGEELGKRPPALTPHTSTIAIVAPAGPFDREILFPGLAWLRTRYRLQIDPRILTRDGYLAGDDQTRSEIVKRAMLDEAVDAIYCARGGYGAMRIVEDLPWEDFAANPKKLVGFSDVTALHVMANARGIPTIHGPNATGLRSTPIERRSVIDLLEDRDLEAWTDLEIVHHHDEGEKKVSGITAGGNLALIDAMAAANRLVIPDGAIVFLEDVTERPFRIDRMLTSLRLGGYLSRVAAIVFGGFSQCGPAADGVTAEEVLLDRTRGLGIPVVMNAPFGHGAPNRAFPLGVRATLTGNRLDWY